MIEKDYYEFMKYGWDLLNKLINFANELKSLSKTLDEKEFTREFEERALIVQDVLKNSSNLLIINVGIYLIFSFFHDYFECRAQVVNGSIRRLN